MRYPPLVSYITLPYFGGNVGLLNQDHWLERPES